MIVRRGNFVTQVSVPVYHSRTALWTRIVPMMSDVTRGCAYLFPAVMMMNVPVEAPAWRGDVFPRSSVIQMPIVRYLN